MNTPRLIRYGWFLVLGLTLCQSSPGAAATLAVPSNESAAAHLTTAGTAAAARITAEGRWVVFTSTAGDLTPNDGNASVDVFVRDRQTGTTELVSRRAGDAGSASGGSWSPDVTPDGRYVVFQSTATNLVAPVEVPPTTNAWRSLIYRFDRQTGEMRLINVNRPVPTPNPLLQGALTNVVRELVFPIISPDGQRVLFSVGRNRFGTPSTGYPGLPDSLFLWDAVRGVTDHITERYHPNDSARYTGQPIDNAPVMSANGRYVAFASTTQLTLRLEPSDVWLYQMNVVVRDRVGVTNIVPNWLLEPGTMGTTGQPKSLVSGISADGGHLLFERRRSVLVGEDSLPSHLWLLRLATGDLTCISTNSSLGEIGNANSEKGALSADGIWVAYFSRASNLVAGDDNNLYDVFLHDRANGTNLRISTHAAWQGVRGGRVEQAPKLTPDGRFVLYQAIGSGLFRYDRVTGTNALITVDVEADTPDISADGRFVVFTARPASIDSTDPNPHRQVYCHDFETGQTELISVRDPAVPIATPNGATSLELAAVSTTGRFIAFTSYADNMGDGSARTGRLWVRDAQLGTNILVSVGPDGLPVAGADAFRDVHLSADGRWVCFASTSSGLVAGDGNNFSDVFLRDLQSGVTRLVSRLAVGGGPPAGSSRSPVLARDGSTLIYKSDAYGIVYDGQPRDLYGYSIGSDTNRLVTLDVQGNFGADGECDSPVISPDGRWLMYQTRAQNVYPEDSFGFSYRLVLKDLTIQFGGYRVPGHLISLDEQGQASPGAYPREWAFSADSQWLVFNLVEPTLTGVYRRPIGGVAYELITTNGFRPLIANGGNVIAWQSQMPAAGYVDTNAAWDVFHHRVADGLTRLVSLDHSGLRAGNGASRLMGLSPDGRYVLFRSHASTLVANDNNQSMDLFLRDTTSDVTMLLSRGAAGNGSADNFSGKAAFTEDGTKIIFESYASDLVAGDFNLERDIFVAQLQLPDSDNDQLPDDWELTYFNTLDHDGSGDGDSDGHNDLAEFRAGTSPINSASILQAIALTGVGSGATTVMWSAVPGRTYQVQSRDDLSEPGWNPVGGPVIASSTTASMTDPLPADPDRFYRVLLVE